MCAVNNVQFGIYTCQIVFARIQYYLCVRGFQKIIKFIAWQVSNLCIPWLHMLDIIPIAGIHKLTFQMLSSERFK